MINIHSDIMENNLVLVPQIFRAVCRADRAVQYCKFLHFRNVIQYFNNSVIVIHHYYHNSGICMCTCACKMSESTILKSTILRWHNKILLNTSNDGSTDGFQQLFEQCGSEKKCSGRNAKIKNVQGSRKSRCVVVLLDPGIFKQLKSPKLITHCPARNT